MYDNSIQPRSAILRARPLPSTSAVPFLTPGQRDWIAQLRARPLRLYRVTDVQPGAGMTLIDEIDPQAQPHPVREISGSRSARPGMLMGARIMQVATGAGIDGHRELSGAIYRFSKLAEAAVLAQARQVLAGSAGLNLQSDNQRDLFELEIASAWLNLVDDNYLGRRTG